jgi:transcriptional regulator GlxA family with amidase domain
MVTTSAAPARHDVAVLALDGVVPFDLAVPSQVFGAARDAAGHPLYRVRTCTVDGQPVATASGFQVAPEHGPEILLTAGTVVVAGIDAGFRVITDGLNAVERSALDSIGTGTRLMSICTGAFVLAEMGRLDDRPATTHWAHADAFQARYPAVKLDPGVLFIDDGDVLTSAGVAAGIDLCLHVIRRDHGVEVANRAARRCVVPPWRDGGQAQFIEHPVPEVGVATTGRARRWALEHLDRQLHLATLARIATMSVRTFTRRFREETGLSPAAWLIMQRVELARNLLETTDLGVDTIARRAGFGTAVSLRQHLRAAVGVTPLAYRRTFRPSA